MSRIAIAVGAVPLVVAATLLAGCGGVESERNLAHAVERTQAQGTARFVLDGEQTLPGYESPMHCDGEADYAHKRLALNCDYGKLGGLTMRLIGEDTYVLSEGQEVPREIKGKWFRGQSGADSGDVVIHYSPERMLATLREASSETERIDEEDVRGASTIHYQLSVACGKKTLLDCDGTTRVGVWIDDDGLVRRVRSEDSAGRWTYEFFDFGADISIEPPPAADVIEEDDLPPEPSGPEVECADTASPITVERASAALARHGFALKPDKNWCTPDTAAHLTNGFRDEYVIYCSVASVLETPGMSSSVTIFGGSGPDPVKIDRHHANVECSLYVENETDEAVTRLDAAFAELRR